MSSNRQNKGKKVNNFMVEIESIANQLGFDASKILQMAHGLSSIDFATNSTFNESTDDLPEPIVQELYARYDVYSHGPFQFAESESKNQCTVFIPNKLTEQLLANDVISESFDKAQRLYQYLNWTIRISAVADTMVRLEGRNGYNVLLIHTELHDQRENDLYALCIINDMESAKAQKWQLASLLTDSEVFDLLGIDSQCLPFGVRAVSKQFKGHRQCQDLKDIKQRILRTDLNSKLIRYQQLKCVQTNGRKTDERILEMGLSHFHSLVREALEDDEVALYPMVSIVTKKYRKQRMEDFSVDYLLPVQIDDDWVGVVYRNNVPTQALMDCYDITNKAILCDPSFDESVLAMFENQRFNRLRIVPDTDLYSNADHESVRSISDSLQSTPAPSVAPSMLEMSPPVMATPSLNNIPSWTPSIADSPSLSAMTTPSLIDMPSWTPSLIDTPSNTSTTSTVNTVNTVLSSLALPPVLITMPLPMMPAYGASVDTSQLLQWTNQILITGQYNKMQFEQFLSSRQ